MAITGAFATRHEVSQAIDALLAEEFRSYWTGLPDKGFFFALLTAWCVVFNVFGTSSFNFSRTPSLFLWTRPKVPSTASSISRAASK